MSGLAAEVHPADVHPAQVLRAEVVVVDVPLPGDLGGIDVGRDGDGEALAPALIVAVADDGLVAPHLRRDPAELDYIEMMLAAGDAWAATARAGGWRRGADGSEVD